MRRCYGRQSADKADQGNNGTTETAETAQHGDSLEGGKRSFYVEMPTLKSNDDIFSSDQPQPARQIRLMALGWRFNSALHLLALQSGATLSSSDTRKNMTITTTASGLQYEEITVGEGAEAQAGQNVTVHYTGWLRNDDGSAGNKFDSSKDRNDPFEFPLGAGRVIKGWDEGVQGMKIGGKRKLIIPAELGYGARGAGGAIPPNATLIFDVELLGV
jgi:FKBP-type peptidyl-prolyl cis-trans isomerase FkpA